MPLVLPALVLLPLQMVLPLQTVLPIATGCHLAQLRLAQLHLAQLHLSPVMVLSSASRLHALQAGFRGVARGRAYH